MLKYLPDHYMNRLLGTTPTATTLDTELTISDRLTRFDLQDLGDKNTVVALPLPDGFGTVDEELARAYTAYDKRWQSVEQLVHAKAPKLPSSFYCPIGWSYWDELAQRWQPVIEIPSGKTFILDAETVEIGVNSGIWHPTCMVAMSTRGWLVWKADLTKVESVSVVPFTTDNDIVGYNVSYDRSYIDVEYRYQDSGNHFYDLMSMWIVTNGMSNQQRAVFSKFSSDDDSEVEDFNRPFWLHKTGTNGLASAYNFYTDKELDKGVRDGIVDGGLPWVSENMESVIRYCALDVLATHELASHMLPAYRLHRPSSINRYGAVALGSCWVPLSVERFPSFYDRVEAIYQSSKAELNELLMQACTDFLEANPEGDLQTASLDWTIAKTGKNKGLPKWYRANLTTYSDYKKLLTSTDHAEKGGLSLSQRWAPLILGMTYGGSMVMWLDGGFRANGKAIAHPTKRGQAVGNMFLKDFASLYENGFIQVADYVKTLVDSKTASINWVSTRKRIGTIRTQSPDGYPVNIPQMLVNGTVTGRAVDLWQVAANPKKTRMGTELKSMVAPYPGYSFVGADVNSQEAWLAACHGDEDLGCCGSTPFSVMTIAGSSKDKTDIHSVVARETGYSRDTTKTRVYGALYGQGVKGDSDVILKANPDLDNDQAKTDSGKFISLFKGKRDYGSGAGGCGFSEGQNLKPSYKGGMASQAFTQMEKLADKKQPKTPLTGAYMTKALAGLSDYKPTRVNWIVQSSGVDFRDMLVLLTKLFYERLGVDGRLVVTIHDEIRTMVKDCDIAKAIYALQLAHLYTRAAFIRAHNLNNIPAGIAWFSEVDVDNICLRKDPSDPQVTPTQTALELGYTVSPTQLLDLLKC